MISARISGPRPTRRSTTECLIASDSRWQNNFGVVAIWRVIGQSTRVSVLFDNTALVLTGDYPDVIARQRRNQICRLTTLLYRFTLGIELLGMSGIERSERRDLFPGALEMMVLQLLRRGPVHGYALAQMIKRTSDDLLQIEEGSLYPALQRMLKAGWVAADWGVSARNRRVRIYRITSQGRRQLEREVSSFERMLDGIARVMRPAE